MKVMVVSAISRETSTCYVLAEKLCELAAAHGVQVDFTHPANAALPIQDGNVAYDDPRSLAWQEKWVEGVEAGLADAERGDFAGEEEIAAVLNKYAPR